MGLCHLSILSSGSDADSWSMIDFIATTPVITMAAVLVFVIGGFFLSKGIVKKHQLRGWTKHPGKIHSVGKGLAAGVSWTWMGEEFHATSPELYSFTSGEEIGLLINPRFPGMFHLDVWTQ